MVDAGLELPEHKMSRGKGAEERAGEAAEALVPDLKFRTPSRKEELNRAIALVKQGKMLTTKEVKSVLGLTEDIEKEALSLIPEDSVFSIESEEGKGEERAEELGKMLVLRLHPDKRRRVLEHIEGDDYYEGKSNRASVTQALWRTAGVYEKSVAGEDLNDEEKADLREVWKRLSSEQKELLLRLRVVCDLWGIDKDSLLEDEIKTITGEDFRYKDEDGNEKEEVGVKEFLLRGLHDAEYEIVDGFINARRDRYGTRKFIHWDLKKGSVLFRDVPSEGVDGLVSAPEIIAVLQRAEREQVRLESASYSQIMAEASLIEAYQFFLKNLHEQIKSENLSGDLAILGSPEHIADWLEHIPGLAQVMSWPEFMGVRDPATGRFEAKQKPDLRELKRDGPRDPRDQEAQVPEWAVDYAFMLHRLLSSGQDVGWRLEAMKTIDDHYKMADLLGFGERIGADLDSEEMTDDLRKIFERYIVEEGRFVMGAFDWVYHALDKVIDNPIIEDDLFRLITGFSPVYEQDMDELRAALELTDMSREKREARLKWAEEGVLWTGQMRWRGVYWGTKFDFLEEKTGEYAKARLGFDNERAEHVRWLTDLIVTCGGGGARAREAQERLEGEEVKFKWEKLQNNLREAGVDAERLPDDWLERLLSDETKRQAHEYMRTNQLYGEDMKEPQLGNLKGSGLSNVVKLEIVLRQKSSWDLEFNFTQRGLPREIREKGGVENYVSLDKSLRYYVEHILKSFKALRKAHRDLRINLGEDSPRRFKDAMKEVFIHTGHATLPKPYAMMLQYINERKEKHILKELGESSEAWKHLNHKSLVDAYEKDELWADYWSGIDLPVFSQAKRQERMKEMAKKKRLVLHEAVDTAMTEWLFEQPNLRLQVLTTLEADYGLFAYAVKTKEGELIDSEDPRFAKERERAIGVINYLVTLRETSELWQNAYMGGTYDWTRGRTMADDGSFRQRVENAWGLVNVGVIGKQLKDQFEALAEMKIEKVKGGYYETIPESVVRFARYYHGIEDISLVGGATEERVREITDFCKNNRRLVMYAVYLFDVGSVPGTIVSRLPGTYTDFMKLGGQAIRPQVETWEKDMKVWGKDKVRPPRWLKDWREAKRNQDQISLMPSFDQIKMQISQNFYECPAFSNVATISLADARDRLYLDPSKNLSKQIAKRVDKLAKFLSYDEAAGGAPPEPSLDLIDYAVIRQESLLPAGAEMEEMELSRKNVVEWPLEVWVNLRQRFLTEGSIDPFDPLGEFRMYVLATYGVDPVEGLKEGDVSLRTIRKNIINQGLPAGCRTKIWQRDWKAYMDHLKLVRQGMKDTMGPQTRYWATIYNRLRIVRRGPYSWFEGGPYELATFREMVDNRIQFVESRMEYVGFEEQGIWFQQKANFDWLMLDIGVRRAGGGILTSAEKLRIFEQARSLTTFSEGAMKLRIEQLKTIIDELYKINLKEGSIQFLYSMVHNRAPFLSLLKIIPGFDKLPFWDFVEEYFELPLVVALPPLIVAVGNLLEAFGTGIYKTILPDTWATIQSWLASGKLPTTLFWIIAAGFGAKIVMNQLGKLITKAWKKPWIPYKIWKMRTK